MNSVNSQKLWWDNNWQHQFKPLPIPLRNGIERRLRRWLYWPVLKNLLQGVSLQGGNILELGCGTGHASLYIAKQFGCHSVTLLDFSQQALNRAREEIKIQDGLKFRINIIQADALKPPIKNRQFDLVHSTGLAEHFWDKERRRIFQVHAHLAKKNKWVMLLIPKARTVASSLFGAFNRIRGFQEEYFSEKELSGLLRKSGLKVVKKKCLFGGGTWGILAVKK